VHPALALAQEFLNYPSALDKAQGASRERMRQYLLLAVLLHVWLIVMFGSAPGGAAKPGEGAWGRLSVLLEGPARTGSSSATAVPDAGPPGKAAQQRFGGTVRPVESQQQEQPGAEKTGAWRAMDNPNEPMLPEAAPVTPLEAQQAVQVPAVPLSNLDQLKPMSTSRMTDSVSRAELPRQTSAAPAKLMPGPPNDLAGMAVPSLEGVRPMSTSRMTDSPTRPDLPRQTSAAPAKLAPVQPSELSGMAAPSLEGAQPMSTSRMTETAGRPELQRQTSLAAPAKLAPTQAAELPNMPLPSLDSLKPMSTATMNAGSSAAESLPRPQEAAAPQKLQPNKLPEIGSAPAVDAVAPVAASPVPGTGSRAPGGSPNAGAQQGHDVATAPSAPDSKKPLNLNLPSRGPMASRGDGSGILPVMPKPPDTKTAMEKAVKQGERADCRDAHAGDGLLAAVPLAADAVRDKGCKW